MRCTGETDAQADRIDYNEENKSAAIRDLDAALRHLHKSKRRKYSPWYSAPTEMFIIALQPSYISRPGFDKGGLGMRRDEDEDMRRRIDYKHRAKKKALQQVEHGGVVRNAFVKLMQHTRETFP